MARQDHDTIDLSDLTLLVIDDNQYMRQLIGLMLRAFNIGQILDASCAREAFDQLRAIPADCILCDWRMPGMSGIDFIRLLRTSPNSPRPDIPIILCTGHTDRRRIAIARDCGVSEILTKPLAPKALLHKIQAAVFRPRPFIVTPGYTGPCRRRRKNARYDGIERRKSEGMGQGDIDALLRG